MATAAQQLMPIAITGEYRADGAFRMLSRDLATAKAGAGGVKTAMASLSQSSVNLGRGFQAAGSNVVPFNKNVGQTRQLMTGLSFQLNDIAGGLAMGQSPFSILAQQGGQVLQVLQMGPGGISGSLQSLKGQIAGLVTPGRAAVLALTAAAGAAYLLYNVFRDKAPTAEEALDQHAKLLGVIKGAYQNAGKAAGEFFDQSRAITLLQTQQNLLALQNQLRGAAGTAVKTVTRPTSVPSEIPLPPGTQAIENAVAGATAFRELNAAIETFNAGARSATDVQTFRDTIAALGAAAAASNPELAKTAAEILKNTVALGELAGATQKTEAMLRLMTGTATTADRKLLGMSIKPTASAYQQLIDRTRDHIETLKEETKYAGQTGNVLIGLKLQQDAVRAAKQEGIRVNQKVIDQLKEELILNTNLKAAAELRAKLDFERVKLGMTDAEASVAETLRSANIDAQSAQGQMLAGQIRVNQSLTETRDLGREALSGFINDLRNGKTAGEAFAGVLNKIADKLIDMAVQDLVGNAFKGANGGTGGIFGMIGNLFGGFFADGGNLGAGKWGIAGEAGPEIIKGPAEVVPIRKMAGGSSSAPTIIDQSTNHFNSTISGSDQNWVRNVVLQATQASEARVMKALADQRARRA